jgi:hypothetical protein
MNLVLSSLKAPVAPMVCERKILEFDFLHCPIISQWGQLSVVFADYVAMVTRIGMKVNRTPFPAEPHVLMYILHGWRKWCGTVVGTVGYIRTYIHTRPHIGVV